MNNTYNNYSGTQTQTQTQAVYGPTSVNRAPMKMANQSAYVSKTGAQGYGATSLVCICSFTMPACVSFIQTSLPCISRILRIMQSAFCI